MEWRVIKINFKLRKTEFLVVLFFNHKCDIIFQRLLNFRSLFTRMHIFKYNICVFSY